MIRKKVYFITGIDTGIGKSVVTGILARELCTQGIDVITQKFIQTGCCGISEDIEEHRRRMGIPLQAEDLAGVTCPLSFSYPASPHMAARLDDRVIDLDWVRRSTAQLLEHHELVLIEGAGGICVPLTDNYTTIDYLAQEQLPVIVVCSPRLGSINHSLLTFQACQSRGLEVAGVVYNHYPAADLKITKDTRRYLRQYLDRHHQGAFWGEVDGQGVFSSDYFSL